MSSFALYNVSPLQLIKKTDAKIASVFSVFGRESRTVCTKTVVLASLSHHILPNDGSFMSSFEKQIGRVKNLTRRKSMEFYQNSKYFVRFGR